MQERKTKMWKAYAFAILAAIAAAMPTPVRQGEIVNISSEVSR